MTRTIELGAGSARVVIAPAIGGSIAAFQCDGEAILRPTPEGALAEGAVRRFACFPLIPFSNRIADATLHWGGREYGLTRYVDAEPHAIHGNGWQRAWRWHDASPRVLRSSSSMMRPGHEHANGRFLIARDSGSPSLPMRWPSP